MSGLEMHVIANGDLFEKAFNAVAAVLGAKTFDTAKKLAVLCSVIGAVVCYIKGRDLATFGKWFILYFVVTFILLGPKVSLHIIDSSAQGAVYVVDNIPYGLALPASLITSMSHGLGSAMEVAFKVPDDEQYNKTGLLFGSKIFGLSTGFHIVDPQVRAEFNEYIKNCVIGDVLINRKYSIKDLSDSSNIWKTINDNHPSPIRGILFNDGTFQTCQTATSKLQHDISEDVNNNSFNFFGVRIFGEKGAGAASKLKDALRNSYDYYAGLSGTAEEIMTQNVVMNGIRDGVLSYASEADATAALVNLSSTQAMERTRMAWATSRNLATYVLPLMQTDILLMLLCMFPLIILIALQLGFGMRVFKSYIYSLIWVESWPILFAVLNLAATLYLQSKTTTLAKGGLTLSNSNPLALEHSDVANMAGYLMTCVPFLAIGIVKGMDMAFSNAAQYIGGMLHSTAAATATEAVTGNISLGNASYNNINANKYDTNSTFMHGMSTTQLPNAALVTHTVDNHNIYNTGGAISHLPINIHASSMLSSSISEQAEHANAFAHNAEHSYNNAVSNALSHLNHFDQSASHSRQYGDSFASQETASVAKSASEMNSILQTVANRSAIDCNEVFKGVTAINQGLAVHGSATLGSNKVLGAGIKFDSRMDHSRSNEESMSHSLDTHINITNEELKKFNQDWNLIQQYGVNHHADDVHSQGESELRQVSADLREAHTAAINYSNSLSESDRLSHLASYVNQHSDQIDNNFNQMFVDYVHDTVPDRAEYLLTNTNNPRVMAEREVLANRFIHSAEFMSHVEAMSSQVGDSAVLHRQYNDANANLAGNANTVSAEYQAYDKQVTLEAGKGKVGFNDKQFNNTKGDVLSHDKNLSATIEQEKTAQKNNYDQANKLASDKISSGKDAADRTPLNDSFAFSENIVKHPLKTVSHPIKTLKERNIIPEDLKK